MTDTSHRHPRLTAGHRGRPQGRAARAAALSLPEVVALILSAGWLLLVGWFFLTLDPQEARLTRASPLAATFTILGVLLPVALVWVAAAVARTMRTMREESARLQTMIEQMRMTWLDGGQGAPAGLPPEVEDRIDRMSRAQDALAAEVAAMQRPEDDDAALTRLRPRLRLTESMQPGLALEPTERDADPLPPEDFIRALDFPANERDAEGFRVLRDALRHHPTAQLVKASQDLLTLLAQDGIYMDDLSVHRADPVLWRAFADGTHGSDVAALGGIRDRSSVALTTGRMKDDSVFRETVHHFLRTFDRVFADFAETASDTEIMRFAETRTARAFMLTARVAGTFD
ncbi:hypothetical protein [Jannaschia rubra]|uniref:Uncharacterized protein n=1 Tax=Jannaschia rubra TaxID=282197 RepID=A0A0M6XU94_9RHOB|nr:hypothetical protein [Jannaschia rubra]CTQ33775.1 hypothetical protein JAN5088_02561 [Jannaschia rubra]SFG08709.1 hypothetical protein SAMN04488517_102611 [Jannaschia rubra]